jgi:hypothetical protein
MKKNAYLLVAILIPLCISCNSSVENGYPKESWIEERVRQTDERLNNSLAGQKVWKAMEAHGGLQQWYANGPLQFHFNYQPLDGNSPRNTIQISDNWSAKVRHKMAVDTSRQFGWDGSVAWALPNASEIPFDARFWALTPYYFVGIPFVLGDEGVHLEKLGADTLNGKRHDLIKVTFEEGLGDAPDDYYILYLDPDSGKVTGYRYVVSYPAYFPDGGHTPEKIMVLEGQQEIIGLLFPEGYQTFMWEDQQKGEHVTNITLSDLSFLPDLPQTYFEVPQGAEVMAHK